MPHTETLSSIESVIEDARNGKMFILVDDEERENEGDLVIPAQMATPDSINFMAKYGRGLICLSLAQKRVETLKLPLMAHHNQSRHQTAFTVSIEAKEGISTGISASDRARTIATAIDPDSNHTDIVSPGHVFPLVARDGGVLVRAGHTEAAVDIARLAGLNPSGVICEIMKDDGTMARMPDLIEFSKQHQLKIATIADLISYRRAHDKLIRKEAETTINTLYGGDFSCRIYVNTIEYAEHVVLVKGDIEQQEEPILVRMHSSNILHDSLGDQSENKADILHESMRMINQAGKGVIVLLREPNKNSLSSQLIARSHAEKNTATNLRDYGIGAQILHDIGVRHMILLTNSPKAIIGLEGYGLSIESYQPIDRG